MEKIILVSNRMATSVSKNENGLEYKQSMGGLATGLSSLSSQENFRWVGWSGLPEESLNESEKNEMKETLLKEYKSIPVPLSQEELNSFYYGFCNNIIWPLFHYFPTYVDYHEELWKAYRDVNKKYHEYVMEVAEDGDLIWVHDYHLMLLPDLIRQTIPKSKIGFFLHIPFPSYELFRLLPWRDDILNGLLGADLIGFHTYDYARHFLSSVRRLLGIDHNLANIKIDNRMVKADVFPMGIDYDKYANSSKQPVIKSEIEKVKEITKGQRIILSVDRLDYSKGIVVRLRAFGRFLERHADYREKVTLIMIVAPSRTKVHQYQELKRELDELVSIINGTYGTIAWTPIQYFFRAFPFDELTAFYYLSEILLVTPQRDGMNLIAKEYVAAKQDMKGVVIISETAGAARELGEALLVNPSDVNQIADTIANALNMPDEEKIRKNKITHRRIKRYDIHFWAKDFMEKINAAIEHQNKYLIKRLAGDIRKQCINNYKAAEKRLIVLDYDGTLVHYHDTTSEAQPGGRVRKLIKNLIKDPKNEVILVSGRDKNLFDAWFGDMDVNLVAGHGIWYKPKDEDWRLIEMISNDWKDIIMPILELYVDRTPGSAIEEKEYSIAWHYRRAEPELAAVRLSELKDALLSLTTNLNLSLLEGSKVLEVKNSIINKSNVITLWLQEQSWEFLLCIGDDWTDEDTFSILPDQAYSIKVGIEMSNAKFFLESPNDVQDLIEELVSS